MSRRSVAYRAANINPRVYSQTVKRGAIANNVIRPAERDIARLASRARGRKIGMGVVGGGLVLSAYAAARAKSSGRNGIVAGSTGGNSGIYGM